MTFMFFNDEFENSLSRSRRHRFLNMVEDFGGPFFVIIVLVMTAFGGTVGYLAVDPHPNVESTQVTVTVTSSMMDAGSTAVGQLPNGDEVLVRGDLIAGETATVWAIPEDQTPGSTTRYTVTEPGGSVSQLFGILGGMILGALSGLLLGAIIYGFMFGILGDYWDYIAVQRNKYSDSRRFTVIRILAGWLGYVVGGTISVTVAVILPRESGQSIWVTVLYYVLFGVAGAFAVHIPSNRVLKRRQKAQDIVLAAMK